MPVDYNDFSSIGGTISDQLAALVAKQLAEKRQAMLDALNTRNVESQIADREANRRNQEENTKSMAAQRDAQIAKAAEDRANAVAAQLTLGQSIKGTSAEDALPDYMKTTVPGATIPMTTTVAAATPDLAGNAGARTTTTEGTRAPDVQFAGTPQQRWMADPRVQKAIAEKDDKTLRITANQMGIPFGDIEKVVTDVMKNEPIDVFVTKDKQAFTFGPDGSLTKLVGAPPANSKVHMLSDAGAGASGLSPEAVALLANVAGRGDLSILQLLGRGNMGTADKQAVLNALAKTMGVEGGGDFVLNKSTLTALRSTLTDRSKMAAAVKQFARTADDNLDLALKASHTVVNTDSAAINRIANAFVRNATPAEHLTDFETKIFTAAREYAKVAMGASASAAGLTDTAAAEASKLLNAAQSPAAFDAAVKAMRADMANIVQEHDNTLADLQAMIKHGGGDVGASDGAGTGEKPKPKFTSRVE